MGNVARPAWALRCSCVARPAAVRSAVRPARKRSPGRRHPARYEGDRGAPALIWDISAKLRPAWAVPRRTQGRHSTLLVQSGSLKLYPGRAAVRPDAGHWWTGRWRKGLLGVGMPIVGAAFWSATSSTMPGPAVSPYHAVPFRSVLQHLRQSGSTGVGTAAALRPGWLPINDWGFCVGIVGRREGADVTRPMAVETLGAGCGAAGWPRGLSVVPRPDIKLWPAGQKGSRRDRSQVRWARVSADLPRLSARSCSSICLATSRDKNLFVKPRPLLHRFRLGGGLLPGHGYITPQHHAGRCRRLPRLCATRSWLGMGEWGARISPRRPDKGFFRPP